MRKVTLTGLARDLKIRQEENDPIKIGLIGCGEMGTDIVVRTANMDGVSVVAIADHKPKAGVAALNYAHNSDVPSKITNSASEINQAIENGSVAITEDPLNIMQSDLVDVIIEATGIPNVGPDELASVLIPKEHGGILSASGCVDFSVGKGLFLPLPAATILCPIAVANSMSSIQAEGSSPAPSEYITP